METESSKRKHQVQPIDNASRDFEKFIIFRRLLPVAPVANGRCGVNTAESVLLPSALAVTATVLVPSVVTGVTTGH